MVTRPLSPSSSSSADTASPPAIFSRNVAKQTAVVARVDEDGIKAEIYCRISLPINKDPTVHNFPLLTLSSYSTLLSHLIHPLPITPSSSPEMLLAEQRLGLSSKVSSSEKSNEDRTTPNLVGQGTIGRAVGRRGSNTFALASEVLTEGPLPDLELVEESSEVETKSGERKVLLRYRNLGEKTESPVISQDSEQVSRSASPTLSDANGPTSIERSLSPTFANFRKDTDHVREVGEWIVVIHLDCHLLSAASDSLRFANFISLPLPTCLRNSLELNLPPATTSSSFSTSWDLSIRPQLRSNSSTSIESTNHFLIRGNFLSTSNLLIRWSPRHLSDNAQVVIPQSSLQVNWGIDEESGGSVTLIAEGELEYIGLQEKSWVDLKVVCAASQEGNGAHDFDIASVEGDGVLGFGVMSTVKASMKEPKRDRGEAERDWVRQRKKEKTGSVRSKKSLEAFALLDQETPRRRPSPTLQLASRPPSFSPTLQLAGRAPSFTSIFDTVPPVAPPISHAVLSRGKEPSLMRQTAPFDGDTSMDMSFETDSNTSLDFGGTSTPEEAELEADEQDAEVNEKSTIIRVYLDLVKLLGIDRMPKPTFAFTLEGTFPSVTMLSLNDSFSHFQTPVRLSLPAFSIPSSESEEAVVTVSAGTGGSVEIINSAPLLSADDPSSSPLPAIEGKARWRTLRASSESLVEFPSSGRRSRNGSTLVELEVDIPSPRSRSTSQFFVDQPSPSLRRRQRTESAPSSLRSGPPLTLSLLRLKITPVPPSAPYQPWRLFTHMRFAHPFVGQLELTHRSEQSVEVSGAWDSKGVDTKAETSLILEGEEVKKAVVDCGSADIAEFDMAPSEGVCELLFAVIQPVEIEGARIIAIGDVLPTLGLGIAALEVEIVPVAGYDLKTLAHTFDSSTPSVAGLSTTFTKFLVPPSSASTLGVYLEPTPPPSPVIPEVTTSDKSAAIIPQPPTIIVPIRSNVLPQGIFSSLFKLFAIAFLVSSFLQISRNTASFDLLRNQASLSLSNLDLASSLPDSWKPLFDYSSSPTVEPVETAVPRPPFVDTFTPEPTPEEVKEVNEQKNSLALGESFIFDWKIPRKLGKRASELVKELLIYLRIL